MTRFVGYLTALLALGWMLHRSNSTPADWVRAAQSISPWLIVGALLCFVLQTLINAQAFCRYVSISEPAVPSRSLLSAWRDSLLAKYLPGGIWQIASRWLLMRQAGVSHALVVQASLFEQGFALGLCMLLGGIFWLLGFNGHVMHWVIVLLPLAALFLWGAIGLMCRVAAKGVPYLLRRFGLGSVFPDASALRRMAFSMLGAMLPFALGYTLIFASMLHGADDVLRLLAAIFLATSAGLAVVFVPGGLGLRESILPILFVAHGEDAVRALSLGVVARVVLIIAEVTVFAMMGRLRVARP